MRRDREKSFVLQLDYGARSKELPFIRSILRRFDKDTLVGYALIVNNNPYFFEFYLYLNFAKQAKEFIEWLQKKRPDQSRTYNLFMGDVFQGLATKRFNIVANPNPKLLPIFLQPEGDETLFFFPEREAIGFGTPQTPSRDVFLSYSSHDKLLVERVFEKLQRREISAWFDRYEIHAGDSISNRVNEGLQRSKLGILFLSRAYLDPASGWPTAEMNYFFSHRMKSTKPFIVVNVDLRREEIPPLLRDIKYLANGPNLTDDLVRAIRYHLQDS